jgi:hypothetical protein
MNHRWKDNTCIHCGVKRDKKTWKLHMAIVGNRDYYQYGNDWHYGQTGFKRPDCQPNNLTKEGKKI